MKKLNKNARANLQKGYKAIESRFNAAFIQNGSDERKAALFQAMETGKSTKKTESFFHVAALCSVQNALLTLLFNNEQATEADKQANREMQGIIQNMLEYIHS